MNSNNTNFFVIISTPRCRSTYLRGLLSSHPDVFCHNEIFHQDETSLYLQKSDVNAFLFDTTWRNNNPKLFVERMFDETKKQCPHAKLIGCKLLLIENQMHGLDATLNLKPRVLFLTRKNKLAWYSSVKISVETHIWVTNEHPTSQHKITFDADEFHEWNNAQEKIENNTRTKLQESNIQYIEFDYEELSEDSTVNRIMKFLDLPKARLFSDVVEQNSIFILNRFNNQEDVLLFAASINQLPWLNQAAHTTKYIIKLRQKMIEIEKQVIIIKSLTQQIQSLKQQDIEMHKIKIIDLYLEQQRNLTHLSQAYANLKQELEEAKLMIRWFESSKSWRITAPLRALNSLVKNTIQKFKKLRVGSY